MLYAPGEGKGWGLTHLNEWINGWVANHCQTAVLVMQRVRKRDPLHNRYLLQQQRATWIGAGAALVSHSRCGAANNNWLTDLVCFCTCRVVCSPSLSLSLFVCLSAYLCLCSAMSIAGCGKVLTPDGGSSRPQTTDMPCWHAFPFFPLRTQWTTGHLHFTLHAWLTADVPRDPTISHFWSLMSKLDVAPINKTL